MESFDITKAKKQIETEAKKLSSKADNFKEFEYFDMDKPGVLQTLAFVVLGFIQDLFLRQDKIDQRNLQIILNSNSSVDPATKSSGYINFSGNIGGSIPSGSILTDKITSAKYQTLEDGTINYDSYSGTISAVYETYFVITTDNNHNLSSGLKINLTFAEDSDLDSEQSAIITGEKTVRIDESISEDLEGTAIIISLNRALVETESVEAGSYNQTDGVALTLEESILNVNDNAYVNYSGLTGGRDAEVVTSSSDDNAGIFDDSDIETEIKKMDNVTRVFVNGPNSYLSSIVPDNVRFLENVAIIEKEDHGLQTNSRIIVSGSYYPQFNGEFSILKIDENSFLYWMSTIPSNAPEAETLTIQGQNIPNGSVKIAFVKDDQTDILPTTDEIEDAKDSLMNIAPINIAEQNIIIENPVLKTVSISISYDTPNTTEMKEAITEALKEFFVSESITLGCTVYLNDIIYTIKNTRDSSGNAPENVNVIAPTANTTSELNELIVLGDVTYV